MICLAGVSWASPPLLIADPETDTEAKWFAKANFTESILRFPLSSHKESSGFIANVVKFDEPQLAHAWYLLKLSLAEVDDATSLTRNDANAMREELKGKIRIVEQIGIHRSTILAADTFEQSKEKWRALAAQRVDRNHTPSELDFASLVKLDKIATETQLLKEVASTAGTRKAASTWRTFQDYAAKSGMLAEPMKTPPKPAPILRSRPASLSANSTVPGCPGKIGNLRDPKLD